MSTSEKDLRSLCPKSTAQMAVDSATGMRVVARTGLVPAYFLQTVHERGWNAGEVHGLRPIDAVIAVKNGFAMELPEGVVEKPPAKAPAAPKADAAKPAAPAAA